MNICSPDSWLHNEMRICAVHESWLPIFPYWTIRAEWNLFSSNRHTVLEMVLSPVHRTLSTTTTTTMNSSACISLLTVVFCGFTCICAALDIRSMRFIINKRYAEAQEYVFHISHIHISELCFSMDTDSSGHFVVITYKWSFCYSIVILWSLKCSFGEIFFYTDIPKWFNVVHVYAIYLELELFGLQLFGFLSTWIWSKRRSKGTHSVLWFLLRSKSNLLAAELLKKARLIGSIHRRIL